MLDRSGLCAGCAVALLAYVSAQLASAALPPTGFTEIDVGSGWSEVAGLAFSSDGTRLYVVERGGKVWIIENGVKLATPFLDISDEVGGWRDFGLLGFALHPNFEQNGYVYALYVVDRYSPVQLRDARLQPRAAREPAAPGDDRTHLALHRGSSH